MTPLKSNELKYVTLKRILIVLIYLNLRLNGICAEYVFNICLENYFFLSIDYLT